MTYLACGYTPALSDLIEEGRTPFNAIEFTPYNQPKDIREQRRILANFHFYFHPGSMVRWLPKNQSLTNHFHDYLDAINPPFVSFHIIQKSVIQVFLASKFRIGRSSKPDQQKRDRFIQQINQVKNIIKIPVILENMPAVNLQDRIETDPEVIRYVLDSTDCDFLLDIPHARVSAAMLDIDILKYLEQLPLNRVRQIHISGPRLYNNRWFDAHEPIQSEDLALLSWVLEKTSPEVVTLEYHKDKEKIFEQLEKINAMIPG